MKLKCPKILLLFELNETLMLLNRKRDVIPFGFNQQVYDNIKYDDKVGSYDVKYRVGRQEFINTLFNTSDNKFETAVWSSLGKADTEALSKAYFGRHFRNLLFAAYTKRENYEGPTTKNYNAIPLKKDLTEIWAQFPEFDNTNTLVVSPHNNLFQRFRDNDLLIPGYTPSHQGTSFETDPGVLALAKYLKGIVQTMSDLDYKDVRGLVKVKSLKSLFERVEYNIHVPRDFR